MKPRGWFAPRGRVLGLALVLPMALVLVLVGGAGSARAFPDVPPDRLDYSAVTWLAVRGAAHGFPDGTFRPDSSAVRAQFVKMVASAMFLTPEDVSRTPFRDVHAGEDGDAYPGGHVAAAYLNGIVRGKSALVFDPYGPLTRAQAMTIAARTAMKLKARDFKPLPDDYQGRFAGFDDPFHGDNARLAEANGLLDGIDLRGWDPGATATRSEAAIIVWNLMRCFG